MKIVSYFKQGVRLVNHNLIILAISAFGLLPNLLDSLLKTLNLGENPILMLLELLVSGLLIIFLVGYLGVSIAFLRDSLLNGKFEWSSFSTYFKRFSWPIFTFLIVIVPLYLILGLSFLILDLLPLGSSLFAPIMIFMPIIIVLEGVNLKEAIGRFLRFVSSSKKDYLFFYLIQAGHLILFWLVQTRYLQFGVFLKLVSFYISFIFLATGIVFYHDYLGNQGYMRER